ncbi:unnamed protein product [Lepeophtheirus salmonis]|uniref:(salmon louse) hypothetical protein n=1 Tax=Lepeophtheirus salmonis TaxID=72036 RepID=A0A7R8D396_LEPSM|nr:unnamed protein product [Lepeophtheirus salmonis]CAF3014257.1 unnamed protein product [Lepeophtheirus salmonis]
MSLQRGPTLILDRPGYCRAADSLFLGKVRHRHLGIDPMKSSQTHKEEENKWWGASGGSPISISLTQSQVQNQNVNLGSILRGYILERLEEIQASKTSKDIHSY